MPDQFDPEAIVRRARESIERDAIQAAERAARAEAQAEAARDRADAMARQSKEAADKLRAQDPVSTEGLIDADLSGLGDAQARLRQEADAAQREADSARAEADQLRESLANLPPGLTPSVAGGEFKHDFAVRSGPVAASYSSDVQDDLHEADSLAGSSGVAGCLRAGGIVSALAGAVLLFFSIPIFGSEVQPGGAPGGSPPVATPTVQSPPVQTPPGASPPAQSPPATGVTGTALAVTDFTLTDGTCAKTFRVGFALEAKAGAFTFNQLGQTDHLSIGTVSEGGDWEATGDGQSYRGRMYGSYIGAVYMDDGGCTYGVRGWLTRMLTEPAPYNTAPGYFEFGNLQTNRFGLGLLDVPIGIRPHIIVASDGDLDVRTQLPITVALSIDDEELLRFVIEGDPAVVCRNRTGCSLDAPFERMASWDGANVRLLMTATGADGQLIAAHAPNGLPAGAIAGPSPSPAPTAIPSPSAAPTPSSSPIPATPPVATVGRGVNVPLAGLGALLLIAGLAMLAGPRLIGGPPGAPRKPPPPATGPITGDEAKAIGEILGKAATPTPGAPTPPPPPGAPPSPPTPGTPPPATGPITGDEAKAIGEILGKAATPTSGAPTPPPPPGTPPPASGAPPSSGAPGGTPPAPDAPKGPGQPR